MNTNPIEQKIILQIEERLKDAGASKHLQTIAKQLKRIDKSLSKYQKRWKAVNKLMAATSKVQNRFINQQKHMQKQVVKTTEGIRKQNQVVGDYVRKTQKADKASRKLGLSLRTLAGGAAALYVMNRFKQLANSSINASLLGGVGLGKQIGNALPSGVSSTSALKYMGQAIADNLPLQFRGNEKTTAALMKVLDQTKFLGPETAGKLTSEFLKGFEGDRKRLFDFLQSVNKNGVRYALQTFANQGNLPAANQLLNALNIMQAKSAGTLDPVTSTAISLRESFEKLQATLDSVIISLADKLLPVLEAFSKLPSELQAGLIGAGILAPSAAGFAAGLLPSLGKGSLKLGRGAGRLAKGPALPAILTALMLEKTGEFSYGAYKLTGEEKEALKSIQSTQQDQRLFDIANKLKRSASSPLEKLRAKRMELDAMISSTASTNVRSGGFREGVADFLGLTPTLPEVNVKQLEKLREQRRKVQEQINQLQKSVPDQNNKFVSYIDSAKNALNEFGKKINKFSENAKKAAAEHRFNELQEKLLRQQDLIKDTTLAGAETALKRSEFDLAKMHVLGSLAAVPEMRSLQEALNNQTEKLESLLSSIDQSSKDGAIQAMKVRGEITELKRQDKELTLSLQRAYLDSIQQQAFMSGRFEKILITQDKNLRAGLYMKAIQQPQIATVFTGSTQPAGKRPLKVVSRPKKTAQDLHEAFKIARDAFEDASSLVLDLQSIVDSDDYDSGSPGRGGFTGL